MRLGTYSAKAAHVPPAALVATRAMAADPRRARAEGAGGTGRVGGAAARTPLVAGGAPLRHCYAHATPRAPGRRAEPRFGERVPYVVVHGEPGARLYDMVVPPCALVEAGGRLRLHGVYYVTKAIIPALDRVLSLVGADLKASLVLV